MGDFVYMQDSYEINKRTLLLTPENEKFTRIYEEDDEFIVPQTTNEIINNSNKYIFVWFCQRASKEQVEMLMDDEGVNLLSQAGDLRDKLNGILISK